MNKKTNISSTPNEDQMMAYINNTMSQEERYAFELQMNESEFLSDATEGLSYLPEEKVLHLNGFVNDLNKQLQTLTKKPKDKRKKRDTGVDKWIIIAVFIILVLSALAFFIISQKAK